MTYECWCPKAQRMALLVGSIIGKRAAEILSVDDCFVEGCQWRASRDCLIGREIEGRW